jgi:hypothetical protein
MIDDATPRPDCALIAAERQLEVLNELVEMTIVVSRAYAHAAVAAAAAVEAVVADEFYQPETARARALTGARDAADSYQKVTRSLRLTLVLQTSVADDLRDRRLGIVSEREAMRAPVGRPNVQPSEAAATPLAERRDRDASCLATLERIGAERERAEFDRPDRTDRPYPSGFTATVNGVRADIGGPVDWRSVNLDRMAPAYEPFVKKPVGWETRPPPPEYAAKKAKRLTTRDGRPPPVERRGRHGAD